MGKNNEAENMQRLFNKLNEQDRISREIPLRSTHLTFMTENLLLLIITL